jgi:hypothetical protein
MANTKRRIFGGIAAGVAWTIFFSLFVWVVFAKKSPMYWTKEEWVQMTGIYLTTLTGVIWLFSNPVPQISANTYSTAEKN